MHGDYHYRWAEPYEFVQGGRMSCEHPKSDHLGRTDSGREIRKCREGCLRTYFPEWDCIKRYAVWTEIPSEEVDPNARAIRKEDD